MNNRIILFMLMGYLSFGLISCFSDENYEYIQSSDCQITSFKLSHDSIRGLDSVHFIIDQVNGYIYNLDSLPLGTEIEKVVCAVNVGVGASSIELKPQALKDSTYEWNSTDSIDFSKPVTFVVHSKHSKISLKTYLCWVNIHKINPDTMVWNKVTDVMLLQNVKEQKVIPYTYQGADVYFQYIKTVDNHYRLYYATEDDCTRWAELPMSGLPNTDLKLEQITCFANYIYVPLVDGSLYRSADGQSWEACVLPEGTQVQSLYGVLDATKSQGASKIAVSLKSGNVYNFASLDANGSWVKGEELPVNFPISGFSSVNYVNVNTAFLSVAAGLTKEKKMISTCWSTTNAISWTLISGENVSGFTAREGAVLSYYDDQFFMIGGIDINKEPLKDVYLSKDKGLSWTLSDSLVVMPKEFKGRGYASVVLKEADMILFGGRGLETERTYNEIWSGRIFRLGFKDPE